MYVLLLLYTYIYTDQKTACSKLIG